MKIAAVIVAFNPDPEELQANINTVQGQVDEVVLVDNSPSETRFDGVSEYIWFPENVGVGKGQNEGIAKAEELGAEYVLLLDQDSHVCLNAVKYLSQALLSANSVAAVGPVYRELNSGRLSGFFQLGFFGPKRIAGSSLYVGETVSTDFLISAGTLLNLIAFRNVGKLREDFFIDYIDTEWCIRAVQSGYLLLGVGGELMQHRIGDSQDEVGIGIRRTIPSYSKERTEHSLMNARRLINEESTPLNWKVYLSLRLVFMRLFRVKQSVCMFAKRTLPQS